MYILSILLFVLSLTFSLCRAAEQPDRYAPLHFQANRWVYDDLKQINTLTGHVVLTKGSILIKADQIVMQRSPEGYQYIKAFRNHGPQTYFRQKRTGLDEYIEGEGDTLTYDEKTEIATLMGRARVSRLQGVATVLDEVRGRVISYDHAKNRYSAESLGDNTNSDHSDGRVRAVLSSPYSAIPHTVVEPKR